MSGVWGEECCTISGEDDTRSFQHLIDGWQAMYIYKVCSMAFGRGS